MQGKDRYSIARMFVSKQCQKRDDIIAAFLEGGTARKEASPESDIDVVLLSDAIHAGDSSKLIAGSKRIGEWRDGIFIDAMIRWKGDHADFHSVLSDPHRATSIHDAFILHDPTGFLTAL